MGTVIESNIGGGGDSEKVKVSSGDTTANFLEQKLSQGSNITLSKQGAGSNETLEVSAAAGSGETNTASNVGSGSGTEYGLWKQKTGADLEFKKIKQGSGVTLTENASDITIEAAASATVSTDNTLWVAESGGTAHGSRTTEISDPYTTIAGALGDAVSGDSVRVLPGTYAEVGLTIPAGVSLIGDGGYEVTSITGGGATTGTRVTLSSGSVIQGFTVTIPTDATYGITYAGAGGTTAGARFIKFEGQSGTADGSGLANTGAGKIIAFEVRYGSNKCENILLCTAGILAIQSLHVPGTGVIKRGAKVTNGRLQALDMNIGNANVIYGVEVGTAGVAVLISLNLFNLKNGILLSANDVQVDALGGKIQSGYALGGDYGSGIDSFEGRSIVVALGVDLNASVVRVTAQMEPNFVWQNNVNPNAAGSDFTVNLIQGTTPEREATQRLFGVDSMVGFPERGSQFMTGEGGANATFNNVVQLDDAGVYHANVSSDEETKTGSTFTFKTPSVAPVVDESIAWCSTRRDTRGDLVKNWGLILKQSLPPTQSIGTEAVYVFEIYTGTLVYQPLAWTLVGVQAISVAEQHRYANDVFLRQDSVEQLRLGVELSTPWNETEINGIGGYYARVRIDSVGSMTATPTFEQLKTTPSHSMFNHQGQRTAHGLAMWRSTLFGVGNSMSEIEGGLGGADGKPQTGLAGANSYLTGWQLKIKKTYLSGTSEAIAFQFNLPAGICTAYPLKFRLTFGNDNGGPSGTSVNASTNIGVSLLPIEVEGTLVADPSGGITPSARTETNTGTYSAGSGSGDAVIQTAASIPLVVTAYKLISKTVEFDISKVYEDDVMTLCIENLGGAGPEEVSMWTLQVEGVVFTEGKVM